MASGQRVCAAPDCGAVIPPQQGSARPRKFCVKCRPPRNRPNPRVINLPSAGRVEAPAPAPGESPLLAAYRKRLVDADRLGSPEGEHAMYLAMLLATGSHTAAGAASLSRELRAAMEVALQGAPVEADAVDEIAARRARKLGGTG